jgi:hypothetical protein
VCLNPTLTQIKRNSIVVSFLLFSIFPIYNKLHRDSVHYILNNNKVFNRSCVCSKRTKKIMNGCKNLKKKIKEYTWFKIKVSFFFTWKKIIYQKNMKIKQNHKYITERAQDPRSLLHYMQVWFVIFKKKTYK